MMGRAVTRLIALASRRIGGTHRVTLSWPPSGIYDPVTDQVLPSAETAVTIVGVVVWDRDPDNGRAAATVIVPELETRPAEGCGVEIDGVRLRAVTVRRLAIGDGWLLEAR